MKRIISITNINIRDDSNGTYEIADIATSSEEAMQLIIRNITQITHCRYGTMNSWLVPDDDKQANLLYKGQYYYGYNIEFAEQLLNYEGNDSVEVKLKAIEHPESILIVLEEDYYQEEFVKLHQNIQYSIVDDLLLSYLPMKFKFSCKQ